jgi:hypothetical protein
LPSSVAHWEPWRLDGPSGIVEAVDTTDRLAALLRPDRTYSLALPGRHGESERGARPGHRLRRAPRCVPRRIDAGRRVHESPVVFSRDTWPMADSQFTLPRRSGVDRRASLRSTAVPLERLSREARKLGEGALPSSGGGCVCSLDSTLPLRSASPSAPTSLQAQLSRSWTSRRRRCRVVRGRLGSGWSPDGGLESTRPRSGSSPIVREEITEDLLAGIRWQGQPAGVPHCPDPDRPGVAGWMGRPDEFSTSRAPLMTD